MTFTTTPIADWLYNHRMTQSEAAKKLNKKPQYIHKALKTSKMNVCTLISLLSLTNFEVKFEDCLIKERKEAA